MVVASFGMIDNKYQKIVKTKNGHQYLMPTMVSEDFRLVIYGCKKDYNELLEEFKRAGGKEHNFIFHSIEDKIIKK